MQDGKPRNGNEEREEEAAVLRGSAFARIADAAEIRAIETPVRGNKEETCAEERHRDQDESDDVHGTRGKADVVRGVVGSANGGQETEVHHGRVAVDRKATPTKQNRTHRLPHKPCQK